MATLHLMIGLPCLGKTMLARRLEAALPALRLTPDEWHTRLFGQDLADHPAHDARYGLIENLMWEVAARVLPLGVDVILDYGLWGQVKREDYRSRAAGLGASSEIHFLDVPEEIRLQHLEARNANLPMGTFSIPKETLKVYIGIFQPPTPDELQRRELT
ncbi:MAG: AAA family ATPase [Thermaceae bacterium]|nr:AAA family ATPase [Thermaceae bacterium]